MRSKKKYPQINRLSELLYKKVLTRLEARANGFGKISKKEANRVLSLALPFTKLETSQLLKDLEEAGLLEVNPQFIKVKGQVKI